MSSFPDHLVEARQIKQRSGRGAHGFFSSALPLVVMSFCLSLVSMTTIWENGDVARKWFVAKTWAGLSFPAFPLDQHVLRWPINILASVFIFFAGDSPASYYIFCSIFVSLLFLSTWLMARELGGRITATWATIIMAINVACIPWFSQFMPDSFSLLFVSLGLYFYVKSIGDNPSGRSDNIFYLCMATIFLFLSYGSKELNALLMPGLVLFELFQKRWKRASIIIAVFGLLLALEIITYNHLSPKPILLGRLDLIRNSGQMAFLAGHEFSYWDIILRWLPSKNYLRFTPTFATYGTAFAVCLFILRQMRILPSQISRRLMALIACLASYALLISFAIVSFNPVKFIVALDPRYTLTILPIAITLVAFIISHRDLIAKNTYFTRVFSKFYAAVEKINFIESGFILVLSVFLFGVSAAQSRKSPGHGGIAQANSWYEAVKDRLVKQGCRLEFGKNAQAFTMAAFAFPPKDFRDPVIFYRREARIPLQDPHTVLIFRDETIARSGGSVSLEIEPRQGAKCNAAYRDASD